MNYIFEFDIASIIINFILVFFYFIKKNIPTRQNKIFFVILCTLLLSSTLDLILTLQIMYNIQIPMFLLWFFNCLSYTAMNAFGLLFITYCFAIINYSTLVSKQTLKIMRIAVFIPTVIAFLIIWLSPLTYYCFDKPLVFYIDSTRNYFRSNSIFFYLLYVFCSYYVILAFSVLIKHRKAIGEKKIVLLFCYILFVVSTIIVQLFVPSLLIQCFGISIASLVFFFYIQRPEEVLDSVTNCFNQTAFAKVVTQRIESSNSLKCISIILDDTYFLVNTFGISRYDDFIRAITDYLKENFKFNDIYHLGPGCFCVVLENVSDEELERCTNQILCRFNKVWSYESIHIKLYSRLCIIDCPKDAKNAEDIIDIINLVTTDDRYKRAIVHADEIDLEYKRRTMFIDHAVRTGLSENRLDVFYQPIWSTKDARLIGAEALIRLKDDEGKFISPEDFIPIAEKNGSILRIGEFVFESVCRTLSAINLEEYGIKKIDINLSVAQCMQEILAEQILTIRSLYNVPASLINLEITETAAAHTPEILLKNMQHLADAGFELSLDDYGSGYSNMNYMLNLPFHMIKIDKYIVWQAYEQKKACTALEATIEMIKKMGMTVLAEGVESKEHVEWLTKLGCDYLQGYYFSKPVPRDQYLAVMSEDKLRFEKENKK